MTFWINLEKSLFQFLNFSQNLNYLTLFKNKTFFKFTIFFFINNIVYITKLFPKTTLICTMKINMSVLISVKKKNFEHCYY